MLFVVPTFVHPSTPSTFILYFIAQSVHAWLFFFKFTPRVSKEFMETFEVYFFVSFGVRANTYEFLLYIMCTHQTSLFVMTSTFRVEFIYKYF